MSYVVVHLPQPTDVWRIERSGGPEVRNRAVGNVTRQHSSDGGPVVLRERKRREQTTLSGNGLKRMTLQKKRMVEKSGYFPKPNSRT